MHELSGPVYMLAADHRWQWEEWCDRQGIARARIPETKRLALDGLLLARAAAAAAGGTPAFLVDQTYAAPELARARAAGLFVGTPVERPGVVPLEWASDPFWQSATGDFVKVLVRHRPEWDAAVQQAQLGKLRTLGDWCRSNGRVFLLEVLVTARDDEQEAEFERTVRPAIVAAFVRAAYAAGVLPDYWKIEGTTEAGAMQAIDAAVAERPGPRLVILGKGAGFELIGAWFAAAAAARRAAGFAIGRSVYWTPATDYLTGRADERTAVQRIADNYLAVVTAWKGLHRD